MKYIATLKIYSTVNLKRCGKKVKDIKQEGKKRNSSRKQVKLCTTELKAIPPLDQQMVLIHWLLQKHSVLRGQQQTFRST